MWMGSVDGILVDGWGWCVIGRPMTLKRAKGCRVSDGGGCGVSGVGVG